MADLGAYLHRIGLRETPSPSVAGVTAIQRAQRLAIPFENLDVRLGRAISLEPDAIFEKLVTRRRGGYCFEQNNLLGWALAAVGIQSRPLLARVWLNASDVPPQTHMLLLATIDHEDWIVDAGFGGSYCPPMRILDGETVIGPDGVTHRLVAHGDYGWMLERRSKDHFVQQFSFTLDKAVAADIAMSNHWTSTAPTSRFVQDIIASMITADGLVSLQNRTLTLSGGHDNVVEIQTTKEFAHILETFFDIALPMADILILELFD